jgi:hypothetical protein
MSACRFLQRRDEHYHIPYDADTPARSAAFTLTDRIA